MSLPARQQRALDQIEKIFQARDPRLTSLFAMFAGLTSQEAMPTFEQVTGRLSRVLQPIVLLPMVVVIIVTSIVLGSLAPGPHCNTQQAARGIALGQPAAKSTGGCPSGPRP
jgi:hypothetical protein